MFPCAPCHEVIPKTQYESQQTHAERSSPARPPADKRKRKLSCNTCRRTFPSERANDLHEPCPAAHGNVTKGPKRRKQQPQSQPEANNLATATADKQRAKRLSSMAANRIAAYRAILAKPNHNGTYNVNGKVMSTLETGRRIQNLKGLLIA